MTQIHQQPKADFDAIVVGGGPSGATAAHDLARKGYNVMLIDKAGRIKPCGGAVPPRLLSDFEIPQSLLVAKANEARIIAPSNRKVSMPVGDGFVGMVDRGEFDEWLRARAAWSGVTRVNGKFETITDEAEGLARLVYRTNDGKKQRSVTTRCVIGADGARSAVARQSLPNAERVPCVFAYHEVVKVPDNVASPGGDADYQPQRCDVYYQGDLSPDFYAWVFPHGKTASIGLGTANKGFPLRETTAMMRERTGFADWETVRCEGAPIPLKPLKRWDNGRNVLVTGDAAGVVAPSSGEGIFYAMTAGRLAAGAVDQFLQTGKPRALRGARRNFMKEHGRTFFILGIMQYFWYHSDKRREQFVNMCADEDVQRLTWEAYMNKKLVRRDPLAHFKIFIKDMGHLLGLRSVAQ